MATRRRFLDVEAKRFELLEDECIITIIERGKGPPRRISFPATALGKVASFCLDAYGGVLTEELKETVRYKGGSLFLAKRSNSWGCFVQLCEWRMKEKRQVHYCPCKREICRLAESPRNPQNVGKSIEISSNIRGVF